MFANESLDSVCYALPYDHPSISRMRDDSFDNLLGSYNPAPSENEVNVLVIEPKQNDLARLNDFYGSYGTNVHFKVAEIHDPIQDKFDAIFVHDFHTLSNSEDAINFYSGLSDRLESDGVLFATFYRQEELDLVVHILDSSGDFEIVAANSSSDYVDALFTLDNDYVLDLKQSLEKTRKHYEEAGIDVDAIIAEHEANIGEEVEFGYGKFALVATKKGKDEECECEEAHEEENEE
jgi:hypothetical protein